MKFNNVNVEALKIFHDRVEADPSLGQIGKRVEGEWVFDEGRPQFRATLPHPAGELVVEGDFAPPMGGLGLAPDPLQYCLYGTAFCYSGTFVQLAAEQGIALKKVRIAVENKVDMTKALGLSDNPIVKEVRITLSVESDAPKEKLEALKLLARERCPGVYCLTNPIPLTIDLA